MAKTYLGDWGTYYFRTNTSSPDANYPDCQVRFYLTYEQTPSANKTTVYVQPYIYNNNPTSSATAWGTNFDITSTINGTSKTQSFGGSNSLTANSVTKVWGTTQSFTIYHNDDGTASCTLKGTAYWSPNGYTRTCSHTWTLPTINRSSSISNNTTTSSRIDFGSAVTFTISRPSTSITHTLTYVENGTTYTIGTGLGDSATYTFPTSYISNYTGTSEVSYVVTCTSSNGNVSTTTVYLKVPDSYKPSVDLAVSDGNSITSGWGIWVQNKSILNYTLTPTLSAGSPIKTYYTSINGTIYYDQSKTIDKFNYSGTVTINSYVTDNRNRTSTTQTKSLTVYAYSNPTFVKCEVVRCNSSGVEDNNGTYGKIKCSYAISPCNNNNAKSLKVTYGSTTKTITLSAYSATDLTSGSTYDFSGLTTTANYTFTFALTDSFTTTTQTYTMPPSFVLVSYYKGGKGISFGQIATAEGFHSYLDSTFHKLLSATKLNLGRVEYSPKTMSELTEGKATSSTSFNTGYSHVFWVNWADYGTYPGYAGMSGFYFQGTNSNSGYIFAIPYEGRHFMVNVNIDGTRWSGWKTYLSSSYVYDALDATSTTHSLSANQGRILNEKINAIPQKTPQWLAVTTNRGWSSGTVNTYNGVLANAFGVWIAGKPVSENTGLSALFIPMPLITTTETNFLINDELQWVHVGMYRSGDNLMVVDRGRGKDGYVSHIYVLKYA